GLWALDSPANDHSAARAERLENLRQRLAQFRPGHADQLRAGPGRVEQGAEKVEDGALAAIRAKFARGPDVLEGWMIAWRKEKREVALLKRARGFGGWQVDVDAERFEDVGAAGLGGNGAVAVLGDRHARRGADDGHGGGNIEGVQPITAGAAHVENLVRIAPGRVERRLDGFFAQCFREGGDFPDGLAFQSEAAQKIRFQSRGHIFIDDFLNSEARLFVRKMSRCGEIVD